MAQFPTLAALTRAPVLAPLGATAARPGVAIHLPDRDAVRDHFGAMTDAYRGRGVATWKRIESDTELGEHAVFTTVRWNALDSEGNVLRDTRTTYHLLATPVGWRLLSSRITSRQRMVAQERRLALTLRAHSEPGCNDPTVDALPTEAEALLAVSPDEFVQERQRVARALRDEGRRDEAEAVTALRKPVPVVLAANRAARDRPAAAKSAAKAAERVAKAQLGTDTAAYRTALAELEQSLDLLAQVALAHLSKGKPASEGVSRRLRDLLRNAVADERARGELVRGVLREETETAGFDAFAGVTPPAPKRRAGRSDAAAKKKQEEEKRREREHALRELTQAEKALEQAVQAEKRAARERHDAERAVESARTKLDRLRADAER